MLILYPMLTPHNYTVWTIKAEAILNAQGVWEAIEPARGAEVDVKRDKKVRAWITCLLTKEQPDAVEQH